MCITKYNCKTNEEWRLERSHSIGASAVGVLFGANHFMTPMTLAKKMKAELRGEFDYYQNLAMRAGHAFEGGVAQLWSEDTGKQIIKSSASEYLLRRDDIPFMHASPDRTYWLDEEGVKSGKNAEANKGVLECKTTRRPIDPDSLPLSWEIQLQVQMGIGGYKEGYIAWFNMAIPDGFGYKRYEFDEEVFNLAVERCRDFWERCVMGDELPDAVKASDITVAHPVPFDGKTVEADEKTMEYIDALKTLKEEKKEMEEGIDALEEALKMQMKDGEEAIVMDGKPIVTWKASKPSQKFDSKRFKTEHEDLYKEYIVEGEPSRRFIVK